MDKTYYDVKDYSTGKTYAFVPSDEFFECLFWIFSLYSKELASDEVVEVCKRVAYNEEHGIYWSTLREDYAFLNIMAIDVTHDYNSDYLASDEYQDYMAKVNGVPWTEYRDEMRSWYRMANGQLEAC